MSARPGLRALVRRADAAFAGALPPQQRRQWLYLRVHRRWPSFSAPRRFSEKVNWRILNDRRPALAWTCDKIKMKEHALASGAAVQVPRTLWSGRDVRELAGVDLPEQWVLKPSHRSGLVHFGDAQTDLEQLASTTAGWLDDVEGGHLAEWAYTQAEPLLFVEELIGEPGSLPPDYKFFAFDGVVHLVQVDLDRFSGHRRSLFDADWNQLEVRLNDYPSAGALPRPPRLAEMLEAVQVLSKGFDFIRIDLYALDDRIVFGEYTPYPGSGLERWDPARFDVELGDRWRLPDLRTAL